MRAIVLARRDFREFDQIISFYTEHQGKIKLLARGVKKITGKNSAHLEPFSLLDIDMAAGREIDHLTKVQPETRFFQINENRVKILSASYVISAIDKLCRSGEKDEQMFFLLLDWLDYLNRARAPSAYLVDAVIMRVLARLGFGPQLEHCVGCGLEKSLIFWHGSGGMLCPKCAGKKEFESGAIFFHGNYHLILKKIPMLLRETWPRINQMDKRYYVLVHNLVYSFLIYQSEQWIHDWLPLAFESEHKKTN